MHESAPRRPRSVALPNGWRRLAIETHLAALRAWGNIGVDLEAWFDALGRIELRTETPEFRGLYLAHALLSGDDRAFRVLFREEVHELIECARGAGYRVDLVEEEWQTIVVRLPENSGSSPLVRYRGTGTLGGFLRVVLLRALARRRKAQQGAEAEVHEHCLPSTEEVVLENERTRILERLMGDALSRLSRKERVLLLLHHVRGLPLTRASVRARMLRADTAHLRTVASRAHQAVLAKFKRIVVGIADHEHGLARDSLSALLESTLTQRWPWRRP